MGALRDLLEVYGALDEAARTSDNPSAAATLDEFLPGAASNTGWYREIEGFFFGENARRSPSLVNACARLGAHAKQADEAKRAKANDAPRPLSAPQKQRLFYGLSAAARMHHLAPRPTLSGAEFKAALVPALAAVGPEGKSYGDRLTNAHDKFDDYMSSVQSGLARRAHYEKFRDAAASTRMAMVDPKTKKVPLCQAKLVKVDGLQCVVIDTNLESDAVKLHDLKAVVNPFNWNDNYPAFFLRMAPFEEPFRTDGWRRVLETVGFGELGALEITTALKYHPTDDDECYARLDYDLDDPTPGPGDGQVLVDRGYINMWVTNADRDPTKKGVGVRTRKVVHIRDLSPFAQQRLVCLTGYGSASSEFLFGAAGTPKGKARPFPYYKHGERPEEEPARPDSQPSTHVVATAVDMWTDAVDGLMSDYFDVAEKWMAGGLRPDDVADFSEKVTRRLVNSPLEFLQRVNRPRYPGGRPTGPKPGGSS